MSANDLYANVLLYIIPKWKYHPL